MIHHIRGKLIDKFEDHVIVEASGVGYQIFLPTPVLDKLPPTEKEVLILTYHQIREDAQTLFGFNNAGERNVFLSLTSVSGVGPKVALKIMSGFPSNELIQALVQEDIGKLTSIPGVGRKLAERLIVELKDKIGGLGGAMSLKSADTKSTPSQLSSSVEDELFLAMKSLGYSVDEIKRAYMKSIKELSNVNKVEDGVKILLKQL